MQQPMDDRSQDYACSNQEHETGVESVDPGEKLAASGLRGFYWPHATQQHRGVEKSVTPRKIFEVRVAGDADEQRAKHQPGGAEKMEQQPPAEMGSREGTMLSGFVHGSLRAFLSNCPGRGGKAG